MELTYYLADFESGNLIDTVPLESVRLSSSLQPGMFSASLDLRKTRRSMSEARALLNRMRYGATTLVPIREGISTGPGNVPVSRELGEWWITAAAGTYRDPVVQLSGIEFAGYTKHLLNAEPIKGKLLDPVVTARQLLSLAFNYSQSVAVNLQSWNSHTDAKVEVDLQDATETYWNAIADLQAAEGGPFEWMIRSGLVQDGWIPSRVTRTLEVGQPILAFNRPDITLEVASTGKASLIDASWGWDQENDATDVAGVGAGAGKDQVGPYSEGRARKPGEPAKSRLATDRTAKTEAILRRTLRAALSRLSPDEVVQPATMPADRYTPRTGEVYTWETDASWTRPAESGTARCVGWSWTSQSPDRYELELVR